MKTRNDGDKKVHVEISNEELRAFKRHGYGLGDAVEWALKKAGIPSCGGCKDRKAKLNRMKIPGM